MYTRYGNNKNKRLLLIVLALVFAQNSYGYIDMNTGSYIVQIALAGFLGALFTLRNYVKIIISKISQVFKSLTRKVHK